MVASVEEALCRSVLFGSATKPNCCFNLFLIAFVTCSDRWQWAFSSAAIVIACSFLISLDSRLLRRCWYRRLFLFDLLPSFGVRRFAVVSLWLDGHVVSSEVDDLYLVISFCWSRRHVGPSIVSFLICCVLDKVLQVVVFLFERTVFFVPFVTFFFD